MYSISSQLSKLAFKEALPRKPWVSRANEPNASKIQISSKLCTWERGPLDWRIELLCRLLHGKIKLLKICPQALGILFLRQLLTSVFAKERIHPIHPVLQLQ